MSRKNAQEVDEVINAAQAEKREKKEAKNAAKSLLREYMKEEETPANIAEALRLIVGQKRVRKPRVSPLELLRQEFLKNNQLSEMEIFDSFKIGRPEMVVKRRLLIQRYLSTPEDIIWIKFFPDEEMYKVLAIGATAPDGWDGYLPVSEEIL